MAVKTWLEERLPLDFLKRFSREQLSELQPRHVSWLHTLGFTALLLFATPNRNRGPAFILLQPKRNHGLQQHQIHHRERDARLAHAAIARVGRYFYRRRCFSAYSPGLFYGAYKKPRELTWMVGVGLFLTTMLFSLTGYLLPWDQLAYWGTVVATDSTKEVPLIGDFIMRIVRGGETVTNITLTRFFALHVSILPIALLLLVSLHLFFIRYYHISPLTRTDEPEPYNGKPIEGARPYYPNHFKKELSVAYGVILLLVLTAFLTKPHLGQAANPLSTPAGIKPEWYFLPVYQSLKYVPGWLGVLGNGAFVFFLLALPLIDRNPERHPARRKFATWAGILIIAVTILLGVLGHLSDTTREIFGKKIYFDVKGIPSAANEGETSE